MKLLICDDDISMVDVIQEQVDCGKLGITRILRAYNGLAAQEIIAREKPELILCDIEMPLSNGMEVLRYSYENNPGAQFIFITNYESFEYAREAIRYGAEDYLTKPLDFEELEKVLEKSIQRLEPRGTGVSPDYVFEMIAQGRMSSDPQEVKAWLKENGSEIKADSQWIVAGIMLPKVAEAEERKSFGDQLKQLLPLEEDAPSFSESGERYTYFFSLLTADEASVEKALEVSRKKLAEIERVLSVSAVIAFSEKTPLVELEEAVSEVRVCLRRNRFHLGKIYFQWEEPDFLPENTEVDAGRLSRLIRTQDKPRFMGTVNLYLDMLRRERVDGERLMHLLHHTLYQVFLETLSDNGLPFDMLIHSSLSENAERSPEDMRIFAEKNYDSIIEKLAEKNAQTDPVEKAIVYIEKHFREPIDREQIAEAISISPNYLSKLFAIKTGENMREFINKKRVEEAKRLLINTNESVSSIAYLVGYDTLAYFSSVFKKQTGKSPVEWRENTEEER